MSKAGDLLKITDVPICADPLLRVDCADECVGKADVEIKEEMVKTYL